MAKCSQLTPLPFKGLSDMNRQMEITSKINRCTGEGHKAILWNRQKGLTKSCLLRMSHFVMSRKADRPSKEKDVAAADDKNDSDNSSYKVH